MPNRDIVQRVRWLEAGAIADRSAAELLPVPYLHVVFTLPAPIAAFALQNKGAIYAILFKTAIEAMTALAAKIRAGSEGGSAASPFFTLWAKR